MNRTMLVAVVLATWLACTPGTHAQNSQVKFDQLALDKQLLGVWKAVVGGDTTITIRCTPLYDGVETVLTIATAGKTLLEEKSMLGYDKRTDRLIECSLDNSGSSMAVYVMWFTSPTMAEEMLLEDLCKPEAAGFRQTFEIVSPDAFILTSRENSIQTSRYEFRRVIDK